MQPATIKVHSLTVRVTHWLGAAGMIMMIMSGWQIYNASPLFGFRFPNWATVGGWLGGAIAWHFTAMWLLVCSGSVYIAYGIFSRHFQKDMLPVTPRAVRRDLLDALRLRLAHRIGVYNAVQRVFYLAVIVLAACAVVSGVALWKPVQLQTLASALGGYEVVRRIHFIAMAGIVGFIVVHLALVILVPSTFPAMITGRARRELRL